MAKPKSRDLTLSDVAIQSPGPITLERWLIIGLTVLLMGASTACTADPLPATDAGTAPPGSDSSMGDPDGATPLDSSPMSPVDTGTITPGEFSCAELSPAHPEWLLCDDFEQGAGDFDAWLAATPFHEFDGDDDRGRLDITSEEVRSGAHALHMPAAESAGYRGGSVNWVQCDGEYERGCDLGGHDELYLRAWVRFADDHQFTHHFLRMGGRYTADSPYNDTQSGYWFNGTAGCLPDGTTHMDATLEIDRSAESPRHHTGYFYSYHPGMEPSNCGGSDNPRFPEICNDCNRWDHISLEPSCDNPDHRCYWGDTFEVDDDALASEPERYTFPKDEWFCVEMRMRSNTPGVADGQLEYWVNDVPAYSVADMSWRSVHTVALNKVQVQHYISGQYWFGTPEQSNEAWFDDVVISTSRVGCN